MDSDFEQELPKDINELIETCQDISSDRFFVEVTTRSLRYKHTKDVSPVFIIPSLKSGHFSKLISRLLYPCSVSYTHLDVYKRQVVRRGS